MTHIHTPICRFHFLLDIKVTSRNFTNNNYVNSSTSSIITLSRQKILHGYRCTLSPLHMHSLPPLLLTPSHSLLSPHQSATFPFHTLTPSHPHQRLLLVVQGPSKEAPYSDRRTEEYHLSPTQQQNLVEGVEYLTAGLVNSDHHCSACLGQHLETLQYLQR